MTMYLPAFNASLSSILNIKLYQSRNAKHSSVIDHLVELLNIKNKIVHLNILKKIKLKIYPHKILKNLIKPWSLER